MSKSNYKYWKKDIHAHPVYLWTKGVELDEAALVQLCNTANMPFIHSHVAAMPDVHVGRGATIGSVIPTIGAIIPAAVGVDIGCGMAAVRTSLTSLDLPTNLKDLRDKIEAAIPVGFDHHKEPHPIAEVKWNSARSGLGLQYEANIYPLTTKTHPACQLGTLGGGNHFIELCLDEDDRVWIMLHSGSRGIGNLIGRHYIELAKKDMETWHIHLPDKDLAYLPEGTEHFNDYVAAVGWAQDFARENRNIMLAILISILDQEFKSFELTDEAVNCHHNYVTKEHHFNKNVWVTRKGAVRAREGDMGIIPGSMGARSFIVKGKGNPHSFHSCSHGAGRVMSRTEAKRKITVDEHKAALEGVECNSTKATLDESPAAYKDIDAVMAAQSDLVEVVHTLKQILCVKG